VSDLTEAAAPIGAVPLNPEVAITASMERAEQANTLEKIQRCCEQHDDWPTLAQHLLAAYPEAGIRDVIRELHQAREAVSDKGFDEADQRDLAEVIARNQLMVLTGRAPDAARLDPERHQRTAGVRR
jgi:hypothetical protein